MTTRPGPVAPRLEDWREPKHNHGRMYRCKIVPFAKPAEYGEWLGTESEVKAALVRSLGARYYCEMKMITCAECNVDGDAKVIAAL